MKRRVKRNLLISLNKTAKKLVSNGNKCLRSSVKNSKTIGNVISLGNKRSIKKQSKWKYGIIAKHNRTVKKCAQFVSEKQRIITRSVARRLNITPGSECSLVRKKRQYVCNILNDDVLKIVFSNLSLKDRFRVQRTCKQFYRVSAQLISEQTSLRIGNIADYYANCRDVSHSTINANIEDAIVKKYFYKYFYMNELPASKDKLSSIVWKCPNVRCIELHNFHIDVETVKWIKWHCVNLECVRIDEIKYDLTARKWSQIGQCLGDKLIHLHVDGHNIKNDITNLVQHLPLLQQFCLRNYDQPINLLLKRLSSSVTSLSIIDCEKLTIDSIKALVNNKLLSKHLTHFEITVTDNSSEMANNEIFALICDNFVHLTHLLFVSHSAPSTLPKIIGLKYLNSLEINFTRDCFLDLSLICLSENSDQLVRSASLPHLRILKIHGSFFTPRMLESIGIQFPNVERLSLTNWAFCCGCDEDTNYDDYDCLECDEKCCQSLLKLDNLRELYLEFLYSSDYIKPLILSLLTFSRLRTVTHIWYPVNTSINSINFIDAIINYGIAMANRDSKTLITFNFEKYVIALINAAKKLPRNLCVKCID